MKQLQGRTALVTGASRGIGRAIALKFAEEGANIVFTHLSNDEQGLALAEELQGLGVQVRVYRSDAADFEAVDNLIQDSWI
ncbi:MAG: SDR family NAD(P)-dependent oxidoreductase, partial [Bacteroidota bacterium]